jgi:hypothetical protein
MPRTYYRTVEIRRWFPPGDEFAAKIARLCILREDAMLEGAGMLSEHIPDLDRNSVQSRQIYFLRRFALTLSELAKAMQSVLCDRKFKAILRKQTPRIQEQFKAVGRQIQEGQPVTRDIRDAICAHVLHDEVYAAPRRIHPEEFGFFEIGQKRGRTKMRFVDSLIAEILLKDVPPEERQGALSAKFENFSEMVSLPSAIDEIVKVYSIDRGLV